MLADKSNSHINAPLAKGSLMQTPHKGEICVRPAGPLLRNLGDLAYV
jgi:hypothetical protein